MKSRIVLSFGSFFLTCRQYCIAPSRIYSLDRGHSPPVMFRPLFLSFLHHIPVPFPDTRAILHTSLHSSRHLKHAIINRVFSILFSIALVAAHTRIRSKLSVSSSFCLYAPSSLYVARVLPENSRKPGRYCNVFNVPLAGFTARYPERVLTHVAASARVGRRRDMELVSYGSSNTRFRSSRKRLYPTSPPAIFLPLTRVPGHRPPPFPRQFLSRSPRSSPNRRARRRPPTGR